ncbi:MAG TPA: hypothetical protein V6C81_00460 [Planktothrix sp.]
MTKVGIVLIVAMIVTGYITERRGQHSASDGASTPTAPYHDPDANPPTAWKVQENDSVRFPIEREAASSVAQIIDDDGVRANPGTAWDIRHNYMVRYPVAK